MCMHVSVCVCMHVSVCVHMCARAWVCVHFIPTMFQDTFVVTLLLVKSADML